MFRLYTGAIIGLLAIAGLLNVSRPAAAKGTSFQIAPGSPASVYAGILAAYRAGRKKVTVPPGIYRLQPEDYGGTFKLEGLRDFEIDAPGATFLWLDQTRGGITLQDCHNVTLRGVTLQNETMPFTQAQIVAIASDGLSYDIQIDAGYPSDFDSPAHFPEKPTGYLFDPNTRQWKTGTIDLYARSVERLGPGRFRLHYERPVGPDKMPVAVGDRMAFRGKGARDLWVHNCSGMRVVGVTIKNGGGFCVHEDGGEGGSTFSYTLTYGPRPAGAQSDPLIACNADAFHSSGVRHGPTLENCAFEGMPDDGIAIHGSYCQVDHADGAKLMVGNVGGIPFRPGDTVRLYDTKGNPAGEAVVRAVTDCPDYRSAQNSALRAYKERTLHYRELTLDKPLPAGFDYLAADPNVCGAGYVIRHCTIRNHRARGMLLKADDGLVENSTIDGSTIGGIVISPELWWNEADYSHHVVIRHNTIRHTGYATNSPWNMQSGGLIITGEGGLGHRQITVENNTFSDVFGLNLKVNDAQDVVVRGNQFQNTHRSPIAAGHGVDPSAVIWIGRAQEVRLENNVVRKQGPYGKTLVTVSPEATHVSGAETGVTVAQK